MSFLNLELKIIIEKINSIKEDNLIRNLLKFSSKKVYLLLPFVNSLVWRSEHLKKNKHQRLLHIHTDKRLWISWLDSIQMLIMSVLKNSRPSLVIGNMIKLIFSFSKNKNNQIIGIKINQFTSSATIIYDILRIFQ
jgi:hypothetical protein